jgi:seryl-tRNA synthetase
MLNKLKSKIRLKLINWLEIDKLNTNLISVSKDFNTYKIKNNQDIISLTEKDKDNFKVLKKLIESTNDDISTLRKDYRNDYNELDNKYDSLHRTIQSCVKMGADIQQQGGYKGGTGSWAVVCFRRGNQDIVKFIDLDTCGRSGYDMFNYLRQFDASKHSIDTPWGCGLHRDIFYMWDKEEE